MDDTWLLGDRTVSAYRAGFGEEDPERSSSSTVQSNPDPAANPCALHLADLYGARSAVGMAQLLALSNAVLMED